MINPTSNTTSIEADSIRLWDPVVKRYVELRDSVTGLAPEALDTLEKIANSIANDPDYATYVAGQLDTKAPLANPSFTGTVSGVTKAMVGLGSVDNTSDLSKPISTATQTALDAKQSEIALNAPLFWNLDPQNPYPMQVSVDTYSTSQLESALAAKATPADITTAIDNLVNAAPAALDTLNELAQALGSNPNFATTVTNALATKAPLASPTFTGTVSGITLSQWLA